MKNTTTAKPHNLSHLKRDRGYRFVDRDPVLDEIADLIDKSGFIINRDSR